MNEKTAPLSEQDLHAYVDGHLDSSRNAFVEAQIAVDAAVAERVRAYRAQNAELHALFDPVLEEPVPHRLSQTLIRKPRRWPLNAAAAALLLAVGGIGGYTFRGEPKPSAVALTLLAERAAIAHTVYTAEVMHPVEVTAEHKDHLVAWLSKRLGNALRTPDLSRYDYQLIGGRLLPGENGPAAQFMYQDTGGARLTLYVSTQDGSRQITAFRHQQEAGVQVLYWMDRDLGFALVADTTPQQLTEMAHGIYRALEL